MRFLEMLSIEFIEQRAFGGVEADGRLVLAMPRRAVEDGVIDRIGKVVNIESD